MRKRSRSAAAAVGDLVDGILFTAAPVATLHPQLAAYIASGVPQSTRLVNVQIGGDDSFKRRTITAYKYEKGGRTLQVGGLLSHLEATFYRHYKTNRSKRKYKTVNIKGSTDKQGKVVDQQVAAACAGAKVKHPMAKQLLSYFTLLGHTLQVGQLPVELPNALFKVTQADLITRDANGQLHCWEIKSGFPVGFYQQQEYMTGKLAPHKVPCTKLNIWHLQLWHTRNALVAAGVPIVESRIVQIYEDKQKGLVTKVHTPPEWTRHLVG
jgi:hypothetical protein